MSEQEKLVNQETEATQESKVNLNAYKDLQPLTAFQTALADPNVETFTFQPTGVVMRKIKVQINGVDYYMWAWAANPIPVEGQKDEIKE